MYVITVHSIPIPTLPSNIRPSSGSFILHNPTGNRPLDYHRWEIKVKNLLLHAQHFLAWIKTWSQLTRTALHQHCPPPPPAASYRVLVLNLPVEYVALKPFRLWVKSVLKRRNRPEPVDVTIVGSWDPEDRSNSLSLSVSPLRTSTQSCPSSSSKSWNCQQKARCQCKMPEQEMLINSDTSVMGASC